MRMNDLYAEYVKKMGGLGFSGGRWHEVTKPQPRFPPYRWALGDGIYVELPNDETTGDWPQESKCREIKLADIKPQSMETGQASNEDLS